ncbi:MAG: parallel beta-helix domain-containing protein [Pirellulaceae bacterium]
MRQSSPDPLATVTTRQVLLIAIYAAGVSVSTGIGQPSLASQVRVVQPGDDAQFQLIEIMIDAQPGDVIQLEEGRYEFDTELTLHAEHVTLRGRGAKKTILSFRGQRFGAGGILAQGRALTFEDLRIEDTAGNAIKVHQSEHVVLRNVHVEWTDGPKSDNGAYGIYPVECKNVLVEGCYAKGASDAGIYVGQCHDVIVRDCFAEFNVAGIEIENTIGADVYDNRATNNTGGLLVFDLPGLNVVNGGNIRVYQNTVTNNNTLNFAPAGTMVSDVPTGTGMMVLATDDVDIFDNTIADHDTVNVLIASFHITQRPIGNDRYDAYPEAITIRGNRIGRGGAKPTGAITTVLTPVLGRTFPDIIYSGDLNPKYATDGKLPEERRLHVANNGAATFVDLHLDQLTPGNLLTGKYRVERDASGYSSKRAAVPGVELPSFPDQVSHENPAAKVYHEAPRLLSQWNLFNQPLHRQVPSDDVLPYELNTALFSDYTLKYRFIKLPKGRAMDFETAEVFSFPPGTVIAKTFAYPWVEDEQVKLEHNETRQRLRLLETRIETRIGDRWYGFSYVWNDEQTDAMLALGGAVLSVKATDSSGTIVPHAYPIPNANQCITCHSDDGEFVPLGPTARNLNRDSPGGEGNQLSLWQAHGKLRSLPEDWSAIPKLAAFDDKALGTDERARAYLEVNCAHCHRPGGSAASAGLDLRIVQGHREKFGVWKSPVATGRGSGGRRFDLVPGKPDESILLYRLLSQEPGVRMPNLARGLVHTEAVDLIKQWIEGIPEDKSTR